MSLTPKFTFGLLNAWILMVFFLLQPFIVQLVDKIAGKGDIYKKLGGEAVDERQMRTGRIATFILYAMVGISIFVPLKSGTAWLVVGLVVYIAGILFFLSAGITAAQTHLGKVFTGGIYRYSRNPLYLSSALVLTGVIISTASWILLIIGGAYVYLTFSTVPAEEQACLTTFGEPYLAYMDATPRWFGIPRRDN